ncbi:MAG TPA: hypothetical protein VGS23_09070 [Thermoplasmata archaeon]|nr:hypothetical protein [Thermoplasmata archaeon]
MKDRREPSAELPSSPPKELDLIGQLAEYVGPENPPRFVLITGEVGLGKSLLLRSLVPRLHGPAAYLAYLPIPPSPGANSTQRDLAMLLIDPRYGGSDPPPAEGERPAGATASSGADEGRIPQPLLDAVRNFPGPGRGTVVVDSWDRGSEAYFRAQATDPSSILAFTAPAGTLGAMRRELLHTPAHIVLAVTPTEGGPLASTADALVELHDVGLEAGRVRVASNRKTRGGTASGSADHLYTLEGGQFRALADLPKGFRPPIGPPAEDPDPRPTSGWPASESFASAFGRLRFGGYTGLSLAEDCPDTLPHVFAVPMAAHVLRNRGRVVWIPAPSIRPSRVVGFLREFVPVDWIRERLRIISASGDDAGLGELRPVVLPLRREVAEGNDLRTAVSPGVGPIFPDAYRFLRSGAESTPALYVMSIEGLRTAAAVAQRSIDPALLPVVFGAYAKIPMFHGFGFGPPSDPLTASVRSTVDTVVHAEMVCGRPVLSGIRPKTATYLLDWSASDARYTLVPQI